MIRFPGKLTAATFLARFWQKAPLFIPGGIEQLRPTISRNELAWLATLDDVESRIVFTDRTDDLIRYRVESGPFDTEYLQTLPKRDWSLLVHDVDKHLPAMRRLFDLVPFVPDWRIDDLMISFAAGGGGVGPHKDDYDVFLCQGIGLRDWRFSTETIEEDPAASDELMLLREFNHGDRQEARKGDVLYLPPGVAHWGTARKACLTYSIGMRAPSFYADPDLELSEVRPGYISHAARKRAGAEAAALGRIVTELKHWLQPEAPSERDIGQLLQNSSALPRLRMHGMARIAYDDETLYVNGADRPLKASELGAVASLCTRRKLDRCIMGGLDNASLRWLIAQGAFEQTAQD
ncbi:MAG: cupin domain-containing protein [Woeseiaceae bacterium]